VAGQETRQTGSRLGNVRPELDPDGARRGGLRSSLARLIPLLGDRRGPLFLFGGASVGAGLSEACLLALVAAVAAAMAAGRHRLSGTFGPFDVGLTVGAALAAAAVLAALRLGFQIVIAWLPARISSQVQARLRRDLFGAFVSASWPVQAGEAEGHLQELMSVQVFQAVQATLAVAGLLSAGIMFLALLGSAFLLDVVAACAVLVAAAVMFVVLRPLTLHGRRSARDLSQASLRQANTISESVRLGQEAHVFGVVPAFEQRADATIDRTSGAFFRYQITNRLVQTLYQSFVIFLVVGGLAALYVSGRGDFAALGAIVLILIRASTYGQQLQGSYHALVQVQPYLERLEAALERYRHARPDRGDLRLETIETLAFEHVGFGYRSGQPVLRDVSFSVAAGDAVGIVGPSGAGKSTIVQLLLRLRAADSGAYLVNGVPAGDYAGEDWASKVAYVPQEPQVIQATVADNIRFFRDLDDAAVERAARLAYIHDEIVEMPHGYDTVIGQRADAVSGGQRQRICLARALAADPGLLVLDEPTSALDPHSEAAIEASLSQLAGQLTLVIVAHRPAILKACNVILAVSDGRVEARDPGAERARSVALAG
jgi:ABC-type multidrug transport system fused ATPase/permease subunit